MVSVLKRFVNAGKDEVISSLGVNKSAYVLLTLHRAENVDSPKRLKIIVDAVSEISKDGPWYSQSTLGQQNPSICLV